MNVLSGGLEDVSRLGFDSSPLIYFIEQHPDFSSPIKRIIRRLDVGEIQGIASTLTLTEVLTKPFATGNAFLAARYREIMVNSRHFETIDLTRDIAELAARLRARYRLRTPDAIQIATALNTGCDAFLTNDRVLSRVEEMRIVHVADLAN